MTLGDVLLSVLVLQHKIYLAEINKNSLIIISWPSSKTVHHNVLSFIGINITLMYFRFTFQRVSSANYLDDLAWHHYCLTFSGESGLLSQYADGKKVKSEAGIAMEIEGGGALKIGDRMESHRYQMSGFNLWDKVLPPEEISDMATSCVKGMGNVKNWYDFSDAAKAMASMKVITPSVCRAPVQHVTETEIEEASTGG